MTLTYSAEWQTDETGPNEYVATKPTANKHTALGLARRQSVSEGYAYVVAFDETGERVGHIGYANGYQDTKDGVFDT